MRTEFSLFSLSSSSHSFHFVYTEKDERINKTDDNDDEENDDGGCNGVVVGGAGGIVAIMVMKAGLLSFDNKYIKSCNFGKEEEERNLVNDVEFMPFLRETVA